MFYKKAKAPSIDNALKVITDALEELENVVEGSEDTMDSVEAEIQELQYIYTHAAKERDRALAISQKFTDLVTA